MKKLLSLILIALTLFTLPLALASCGEEEVEAPEDTYVEISVKDYGKIVVFIDGDAAPVTATNFLKLVKDGFYDGLTFHRVVKDFVIQGGDPEGDGTGNSNKTIKGEFSENGYDNPISHERGVISMARGKEYDSASCQFFICNADARDSLDGKYAAFGHVVEGMDVVDEITESTAKYGDENGTIRINSKKPVIEYIKVLENYSE